MVSIDLTVISFSDTFADKNHVAPRLSFVNVPGLNKLLRSKIFISEDRQLRAAHLILDYEPLSCQFQDTRQAIRSGDSRLNRIDVSKLGFLARRDLPPIEFLVQRAPPQVASLRKESAFSRHTLDAEIDKFRFKEEGAPERALDFEHESDRFSTAHLQKLIVARVYTSSEIEEEGMDLKPKSSLKGLLVNMNKASTSKEVPKTQVPPSLPLPLPPTPTDLKLKAIPNLRKKRPVEDLEEGEVAPQKGAK